MIQFYQGSRLEALAEALANAMQANPPSGVFDKQLVVVHSQGMARWLMQQLATHSGISANVDFIFPGKFLNHYVYDPMVAATGDERNSNAFSVEAMTWSIMRELDALKGEPEFQRLRDYIGDDSGASVKQYQISHRIAGLFDRYMAYRPDLLREWEGGAKSMPAGRQRSSSLDESWQRVLWNILAKAAPGTSVSSLFWQFLDADDNGHGVDFLGELKAVGHVYFFGISSLPPAHLEVVQRASKVVDVHFYWLNPSHDCWDTATSPKREFKNFLALSQSLGNEELAADYALSGNPLLGSWGRVGQEFFKLLVEARDGDVGIEVSTEAKVPDTLLEILQDDIRRNQGLDETVALDPMLDSSVAIHNCFSPMREVEALYDNLLTEFLADDTLLPKDVTVYVPDMEEYAPYIEAVFGSVPYGSPKFIPYTVADRSLSREHPECRGFQSLLSVVRSRFKADEVLSLLDIGAVCARMGFADGDVSTLRQLLLDSRVAWGIDESFRERASGVGFHQNSWRFALDRLVLGVAMGETGIESFESSAAAETNVSPLGSAEGRTHIVGKFAEFMERLFDLHDDVADRPERPANQWLDMASAIVDETFSSIGEYAEGTLALKRTLGSLRKELEDAEMSEHPMTMDLFESWVKEHLEGRGSDERFCRGLVTFCRFQPMRSIPSRITCVIGMSDNAFPRQDRRISFDLMSAGDRYLADGSTKNDDRYSFLECILSAREKLYVSYVGQSDKGKDELPPSVLLSELCDYLNARFEWGGHAETAIVAGLTATHPLHPFGEDYFLPKQECASEDKSPRPQLTSHSKSWFAFADRFSAGHSPGEASTDTLRQAASAGSPQTVPVDDTVENEDVVSLEDLITFYRSPCKHYYNRVLGIDLDVEEETMPTPDEPMDVGGLQQWSVRNTVFNELVRNRGRAAEELHGPLKSWFRNDGLLAVGLEGDLQFDALWNETLDYRDRWESAVNDAGPQLETISQVVDLGAVKLQVRLSDVHEKGLLIPRLGKLKWKDRLDAMVRHAAMSLTEISESLCDGNRSTIVVSLDGGTEIPPMDSTAAKEYLIGLVEWMKTGLERPICYWGPSSAAAEDGKSDDFEKNTKKKWEPGGFRPNYEQADAYTRKAFGVYFPMAHMEEFKDVSAKTMRPFFELLKGEGGVK